MYCFKMKDYKLSTFPRNVTFFSPIKAYAISQKSKVFFDPFQISSVTIMI